MEELNLQINENFLDDTQAMQPLQFSLNLL